MLQFEELRLKLAGMEDDLNELSDALGMSQMEREVEELEQRAMAPNFWDNMEAAQKVTHRVNQLHIKIDGYNKLKALFADTMALIELADEMEDLSMLEECAAGVTEVEETIEKERLSTLLTGQYDANNAILTFHAGAGGTEAQDWASMLYRMYTHWAESRGFSYDILDYQDGDEAGIKSASIVIKGENAYGYMKSEAGIHRLVRVSPFDASGRRHTSFAAVEVIPELDEDVTVEIRPEDIKMEVFRSSGAGGQHVNKTSSAVRLIHIPTGIVVSCQTERSQFQNRDYCMRMLTAKLIEIKEREHLARIEDIKGSQAQIAWGSQIRSYVFMPYTMVKDHRTSHETGNVNAVMDGELDGFINAYLQAKANNALGSAVSAE
ncbi:MAG: peptide chain release factor 2 [Clostridia bacterium]|nr:peptide chain release factor 2 [Clostridia bacterium]